MKLSELIIQPSTKGVWLSFRDILTDESFHELFDDDYALVEISALPKNTGLEKTIFISPKMASHGPRIKYYPEKNKNACICFSISPDPNIVAKSKNIKIDTTTQILIEKFIELNYNILKEFWDFGNSWSEEQIRNMIDNFNKA